MNPENISPKGANLDENSQLVDLIKALPKGTISGIKREDDVTIEFRKRTYRGEVGSDLVRISSDYDNPKLIVNVPNESTYSLWHVADTLSFEFGGTCYMICPVESFNILE